MVLKVVGVAKRSLFAILSGYQSISLLNKSNYKYKSALTGGES